MTRRYRPQRHQNPSAWGAGNVQAAARQELEAETDGLEMMTTTGAQLATRLMSAKVLAAFTRDVPIIAIDPDDNSMHAPGGDRVWAPPWFRVLFVVLHTAVMHSDLFKRINDREARDFALRILRDEPMQQALTAVYRIGGDDALLTALHNELRGEPDADAPRPEDCDA